MTFRQYLVRTTALLLLALITAGCAQTPERGGEVYDPLEPANRGIYTFNETLDDYILAPVADGYTFITPVFFRRGVDNFFSNLAYPGVVVNDFLQGKVQQGFQDLLRFGVNSTFGIGGIFDPAATMGLPQHNEDFGQTLGVWGTDPGAYLVLPAFGSSNARDVTSYPVGVATDASTYYVGDPITVGLLYVLNYINQRALLDKATRIRDEAALDPYAFTRSAYMQYRRNLVYDGNPPVDTSTEDFFEQMEMDEQQAPPPAQDDGS